MNIKEAIKVLKNRNEHKLYRYSAHNIEELNKAVDTLIELSERGEKFEFIFSDIHSLIQHLLDGTYLYGIKTDVMTDAEYIAKAFEIIEEKYFPKSEKSIEKCITDALYRMLKGFIETHEDLLTRCATEYERRKDEKINEA